MNAKISVWWALCGGVALVAVQAIALYLMGQPGICECGFVKVWEGVVLSPGNSQHLSDWYTFSHILHGLLFYVGIWFFFPRLSVWTRLLLALGIEIAWEILENTPMVIDHYRQQTLSQSRPGEGPPLSPPQKRQHPRRRLKSRRSARSQRSNRRKAMRSKFFNSVTASALAQVDPTSSE